MDIWTNIAFSVIITLLQTTIKNPKSKAVLKAVLLKIYGLIALLYAGDPDFNPFAAASKQASKLGVAVPDSLEA
jgi:hypothetical protein